MQWSMLLYDDFHAVVKLHITSPKGCESESRFILLSPYRFAEDAKSKCEIPKTFVANYMPVIGKNFWENLKWKPKDTFRMQLSAKQDGLGLRFLEICRPVFEHIVI